MFFTIAFLLLSSLLVFDAGGTRGFGLLYILVGYSILYFVIGIYGAIIIPLFIFFGTVIRLSYGSFNQFSIFNIEGISFRFIILMGIGTFISIIVVLAQHYILNTLTIAAFIDKTTGLNSRRKIEDFLKFKIMDHYSRSFSVIGIKILHFSEIHSHFGTLNSDQILMEIGSRLKAFYPKKTLIGRYTGTIFMAIVDDNNLALLDKNCQSLIYELNKPITVDNQSVIIQFTLSVTRYPDDGGTHDKLFSNLMTLISKSKEKSGEIKFYDEAAHIEAHHRFSLGEALKNAISNNELYLVYHPKINLKSHGCSGAEVLLRWNSKEFGNVGPDVFIPIGEEVGIIRTITRWVIRQTLSELEKINSFCKNESISRSLLYAINLSPIDLSDDSFPDFIENVLSTSSIEPEQLEFEITEGILIDNNITVEKNLTFIRNKGIRLAMDDFGTGYSSLSYLHNLRINNLKIDKSFITPVDKESVSSPVVEAIISLAHSLRLDITAEGVETEYHDKYLAKLNCTYGQGWLYAKPMPLDKYIAWLKGNCND